MRRWLTTASVVGVTIGVPALVLQRWFADTRLEAILFVVGWLVIVGVGVGVIVWRRPSLRRPALVSFAGIVVAMVAVGYWTGFRDVVVNEDVAMATVRASGEERETRLAGQDAADKPTRARGPVELARARFYGADGHAGTGTATVVQRDGERVVTFTEFDVDPGVDVDVYLTISPEDVSDRVELGNLKGNVGDQQYAIPADADLRRYSNVILWCKPFTVRIAVAEFS
jgi:hypothetical protein